MTENWIEKNHKYLSAQVSTVKSLLKSCIAKTTGEKPPNSMSDSAEDFGSELPAIEMLKRLFGLSPFEKQLLILCAAAELDSETRTLIAEAQGNLNLVYPTFSLALGCLPNPHWSAVSPASPLRRFRLIEVNTACSITASPLHISEKVLHYLTGVSYLDTQLRGLVKPASANLSLVESHSAAVNKILSIWQNTPNELSPVELFGPDSAGKLSIAQNACSKAGLHLWTMQADLIPQKPDEAQVLAEIWTRESALLNAVLFVSAEEVEPATQRLVLHFIDNVASPVFLGTRDRWPQDVLSRISLQVNKPLRQEQHLLWQQNLDCNDYASDAAIDALVSQFDLDASAIQTAVKGAQQQVGDGSELSAVLWQAACNVSRPRIAELAQQITPKACMENLVLPNREKQLLKEIIMHVANRHKVYNQWGFEAASSRGLGITALFSGSSGTGKTMAAEVIAHELRLDLFRIDLSAVVSKYIGETEKNLRKLFDAAEDGGAILFFDEADALFGKRSQVKDSHDRYANIEINYLLQRMENYRGLAILATNMREALDSAFVRRLKFIVNYPFPDEESRLEIWQHIFPKETPTENLDYKKLAKLNIAGGNIRNIALYSAFLAANEGSPVNMHHIKRAVQVEYAKTEKPVPQSEVGGW